MFFNWCCSSAGPHFCSTALLAAGAGGGMPSFVIKAVIKVERSLATHRGSVKAAVAVWEGAQQAVGREVASAVVRLDPDDKDVEIRKADPCEGLVAAVDWSSAQEEFSFTLTAGVRRPGIGERGWPRPRWSSRSRRTPGSSTRLRGPVERGELLWHGGPSTS